MRRISDVGQIGNARILYVGGGGEINLHAIVEAVGTRPVLVVTDDARGLTAGSTINFIRDGRKLRFEVSLAAAERSQLRISSDLLAVASRVQGAPSHTTVSVQ